MQSFAVTKTVIVRNGVFPAISVNKDVTVFSTCSPVWAPEPKGTQEGEEYLWSNSHQNCSHSPPPPSSCFSRVRLCATPRTAAYQASPSMGILQARILEWIAMPSSRGSSQPRDQTPVSCIASGFFFFFLILTVWATREVHPQLETSVFL